MNMNVLVIGNIASGKSSVAEALVKLGFTTKDNVFSIDTFRQQYSDGTYAGEFFAWAKMLQVIQYPTPNANCIYEFSGTGKNAWFAREAIKLSKVKAKANWRTVYCSCDTSVIKERCIGRVYNVPLPYKFGDIGDSIRFIGDELSKRYNTNYWDCPELVISTDKLDPTAAAKKILKDINFTL